MYGQIHCILREMVQVKFGLQKWGEVTASCDMDEDRHFLVFSVYEDATTFRLIDSVSRVLGIPYEMILREFGTYFLTYCMKHGYDKMLLTLGQDLFTFIQNLDSLHSMLSLSYKGIVSPSFRCTERDDGAIILHYYSWRDGFYPIVQGLVEAVGRDLFNQVATVSFLSSSQMEMVRGKIQYHTSMKVELKSRALGYALVGERHHALTLEKLAHRRMIIDVREPSHQGTPSRLSLGELDEAFPYNILMDSDMCIQECGAAIRRLLPFHIDSDTRFPAIATIRQPVMSPTVDHIISFTNSIFIIDIIHDPEHKLIPLKGQMIWLPHCCHLLFVGSPRLQSLDEFKERNVFISDVPLYDATRELVLLNQQRMADIEQAHQLDSTMIALKSTSKELEKEKLKTEQLLLEMMPRKIADQLFEKGFVNAEKYRMSSVLFSSIVTFADIVWTCTADQVVTMLNDLYNRCDTSADEHDVYKVETIGDAYMAVTGVPQYQEDHAARMADFAMDILEEADHIYSPATLLPLQLKIGFHSGSLVAGVIGLKKPRYDIYGDTVNTASRMCGSSVPGRIHVTDIVFGKLLKRGYMFKSRGEIEVKGKGKMSTYFLVGTQDRPLCQPNDVFSFLPDILEPEVSPFPDAPRTSIAVAASSSRKGPSGLFARPGFKSQMWMKTLSQAMNTDTPVPSPPKLDPQQPPTSQPDSHHTLSPSPTRRSTIRPPPTRLSTIRPPPKRLSVAGPPSPTRLSLAGPPSPTRLSLAGPPSSTRLSLAGPPSPTRLSLAGPSPPTLQEQSSLTPVSGKNTAFPVPDHHQQTWKLTPKINTAAHARTPPMLGHSAPSSPADIVYQRYSLANPIPPRKPAGSQDLLTPKLFPPDSNTSCHAPPFTAQAAFPEANTCHAPPRTSWKAPPFTAQAAFPEATDSWYRRCPTTNRNTSLTLQGEVQSVSESSFHHPSSSPEAARAERITFTEDCEACLHLKQSGVQHQCTGGAGAQRTTLRADRRSCVDVKQPDSIHQHTDNRGTENRPTSVIDCTASLEHSQSVSLNPYPQLSSVEHGQSVSLNPYPQLSSVEHGQSVSLNPYPRLSSVEHGQSLSLNPYPQLSSVEHSQSVSLNPYPQLSSVEHSQSVSLNPYPQLSSVEHSQSLSLNPYPQLSSVEHSQSVSLNPYTQLSSVEHSQSVSLNPYPQLSSVEHSQSVSLNPYPQLSSVEHSQSVSLNPYPQLSSVEHSQSVSLNPYTQLSSVEHGQSVSLNPYPQLSSVEHSQSVSLNPYTQLLSSRGKLFGKHDTDLPSSVEVQSDDRQLRAVGVRSWPRDQNVWQTRKKERKAGKRSFWTGKWQSVASRLRHYNRSSSQLPTSRQVAATSQLSALRDKSVSTSSVCRSQQLTSRTPTRQLTSKTESVSPQSPSPRSAGLFRHPGEERDPPAPPPHSVHVSSSVPCVPNDSRQLATSPQPRVTLTRKASSRGHGDCSTGQGKRKTGGKKCSVS